MFWRKFDFAMLWVTIFGLILTAVLDREINWLIIPCGIYFGAMVIWHYRQESKRPPNPDDFT